MTDEEKRERRDAILNKQFEMAMNGSIEMLKWLGIQYCGQDNKPNETEQPLPQGFNVRTYSEFENAMYGSELRDEFEDFLAQRENNKTAMDILDRVDAKVQEKHDKKMPKGLKKHIENIMELNKKIKDYEDLD